ncbi:MAG: glycine cleavage system protein GcvH [Dehalococcoidia bacterium]|nr:glycine cleavage system protein GcvH [Dehalococcoidia bacterium]MEE2927539.1 glycine cleavage system protein GcvH [Chloroflexota bacterium]HIB10974.1 glycine cleavage system protein GcvH [Dehalococcoidia bacterium]
MSPDDRKYSKEHEWVKMEDATQALAGITVYAQDQLGDIVYVDLPKTGATIRFMEKMGEVESVKAVSDLFSPITGEVTEINDRLLDHPELVNEDPLGEGWMVRVTVADTAELDQLMSAEEYEAFISGLS